MADHIIYCLKAVAMTEALTHAVRSWGIFDPLRARLTSRSAFLARLLACYECTSVWVAAGVLLYLALLDFWPLTYLIIFARLATIGHIAIDAVDALRAFLIGKL